MSNFYITTPIFYANGNPHLGHAYTMIIADIIARHAKLAGLNVKFTTGTDEYGQKIEQSANNANISTQEFVDKNTKKFLELTKKLNVDYTDFIRTTETRHHKSVHHIIDLMWKKGVLYKGKYEGWYSIVDEAFFKDDELTQDKKSPTGAEVKWISEESIFFALSKFQDQLLDFYTKNPDFITPSSISKEVINFIEKGLEDLSVSRTNFSWGIPMQLYNQEQENKKHIVYVWLDALINYLSSTGYPDSHWNFYWPANYHIIGKDILRFHCIYWPAFLMSVDLPMPKKVAVHGWWKNEGKKMSKSFGNVLNPTSITEKFGVDYVRYFLAREMIFGQDASFSEESFINRINSELVNKVGNLIQRMLIFNKKVFGNFIPKIKSIDTLYNNSKIISLAQTILDKNICITENFKYADALEYILHVTSIANKYLDETKPWKEVMEDRKKDIIYEIFETARYIIIALSPFIPMLSTKVLDIFNVKQEDRVFAALNKNYALKPGSIIQDIPNKEVIFPIINKTDCQEKGKKI